MNTIITKTHHSADITNSKDTEFNLIKDDVNKKSLHVCIYNLKETKCFSDEFVFYKMLAIKKENKKKKLHTQPTSFWIIVFKNHMVKIIFSKFD